MRGHYTLQYLHHYNVGSFEPVFKLILNIQPDFVTVAKNERRAALLSFFAARNVLKMDRGNGSYKTSASTESVKWLTNTSRLQLFITDYNLISGRKSTTSALKDNTG